MSTADLCTPETPERLPVSRLPCIGYSNALLFECTAIRMHTLCASLRAYTPYSAAAVICPNAAVQISGATVCCPLQPSQSLTGWLSVFVNNFSSDYLPLSLALPFRLRSARSRIIAQCAWYIHSRIHTRMPVALKCTHKSHFTIPIRVARENKKGRALMGEQLTAADYARLAR